MRLRKRRFFCGKVEKGKQMEERKPLIPVKELAKRYALFIISLFISALGVAITKKGELGVSPISSVADVVMNSGEAFVKSVSDTVHKEFGSVKVVFDISCVIVAVVLSLIFFDFHVMGTREGTIIAAVLTGFVVKFWNKLVRKPLEKLLVK
jgi:hypothetical protein